MQTVIDYIASEWARSGNPAWLKAAMLAAVPIMLALVVHMIADTIREYRRLCRAERLERLQDELADRYAKQFHYEGRQPHGKKTH